MTESWGIWYLCLCENQFSGIVIIICWNGQSMMESQDRSFLVGKRDLSKNDWLFLRTCQVSQVIQHHSSCSSGEDKTILAVNLCSYWRSRADNILHKASIFLWGLLGHLQAKPGSILLGENVSCSEENQRFPFWVLILPFPPLGTAINTSSNGFSLADELWEGSRGPKISLCQILAGWIP